MGNILRVESISLLHEIFGYDKPKHPLISLIDLTHISPVSKYQHMQVVTGLYTISLKNGINCDVKYGRQYYDFDEGSLVFMAPGQVTMVEYGSYDKVITDGKENWMLCFHPDLIRKSKLGSKINEYSFFSYDVNEALHLSEYEKNIVTSIVRSIEHEYCQNIDVYSQDVIISNIELLLNHCNRFYGRQFITRSTINKDVVSQFETLIRNQIDLECLEEKGIPSVKSLAHELGYSPNYLSDLLKKETGKNVQEHIQLHLVEKAKTLLLNTSEPVYQISYRLGFEYPSHFSKFFKAQTGMSPVSFRK
ncbi:Hypothetical protein LUCI_3877 [Lucifera butyrica]|uniref:HTH araC/xylS-type domain-containing protein n=1 Tax=Lucifera butyrica TaxID=1351585 RepID=A0A498RBH9_9FIRM|nr:helix-turn-helix domain-containing protein [Lucifera butyrica]VBB08599.1 Hypothetical protein LUCI_3877 [Lucifera butyrica]